MNVNIFSDIFLAVDLTDEVIAVGGYLLWNVCLKTGDSTACMLKAMIRVEKTGNKKKERR